MPSSNHWHGEIIWGNKNIYLHFTVFGIWVTEVNGTLPGKTQQYVNLEYLIPWLLISWRHKEQRHHRPSKSHILTGIYYNGVIMGAIASQITSLTIVYSPDYTDEDQRKHQSSASLAFVRGIHRGPVYSPHKWPVMRKMFPFDDVSWYEFQLH